MLVLEKHTGTFSPPFSYTLIRKERGNVKEQLYKIYTVLIRDFFSVARRRQLEVHIKSLSPSNEMCLTQPRKTQLNRKRMQLLSQRKKKEKKKEGRKEELMLKGEV